MAELISKEYAARQRKRIDMQHAATSVEPGDPLLAKGGDTIYLCVVDKDRNCCSFIQSNFAGFGSRVVPGNVGFVMQNRGSQFSLDPKHLNTLEPHKRPFHTIIPAMVTKDGKPWLCFGVMGGDMQPQGHVQVLVNMIDFGLNVQAAGDEAASGTTVRKRRPADRWIRRRRHRRRRVEHSAGDDRGARTPRPPHRRTTAATASAATRASGSTRNTARFKAATEPRKDGAAVGY